MRRIARGLQAHQAETRAAFVESEIETRMDATVSVLKTALAHAHSGGGGSRGSGGSVGSPGSGYGGGSGGGGGAGWRGVRTPGWG